ncbi:cuticle protein 19.8-like [Battus philenor]|uniref:cuticle protein 19.8-like n=1 Tax=Battus philenor TaxID=42288 RepID=UPI0035D077A7
MEMLMNDATPNTGAGGGLSVPHPLHVSCLLAFATSSKGDGTLDGLIYAPAHSSIEYYTHPSYAYDYAVKDPYTGDNKAQWEKRDGDTVKGGYSLVEPDGSLRVVEYWADSKSGFNAVVKRIGPNLHPVSAPVYKAPISTLSQGIAVAPISVGSVAKIESLTSAPAYSGSSGSGYSNPIAPEEIYKAPIIKSVVPIAPLSPLPKAPIMSQIIVPDPIAKLPIKQAPLLSSELIAPWSVLKDNQISTLSSLQRGLLKGSLISDYDGGIKYGSLLLPYDSMGWKH